MMEFTISRVALGMCGLILLATVISPVTSIYDDREDAKMQDLSESIAAMIDAFYDSEADSMAMSVNEILPSSSSSMRFDGHLVCVTDGDAEHRSSSKRNIVSDKDCYNASDIIKLTRSEGGVIVETIS
jgi:hypothetical protein